MCSAPTCHVANVRPSIDSSHIAVVSRNTPEYQCLWFQFYRASNFYCMAIAAEPSSPSGPPSVADRAAVSGAAASETSVTASAVVASAPVAIAIAIADDDDHPRNGHDADNCIQTMTRYNRMDDTEEKEHSVPSSPGIEMFTLMGGNGDDVQGYEGDVAAAQ